MLEAPSPPCAQQHSALNQLHVVMSGSNTEKATPLAVLSRKIGAKTGTKEAGQLCLSDPGLLAVTPRGPHSSHQMSPNPLQLYTTMCYN